jgi:hypothetical protein
VELIDFILRAKLLDTQLAEKEMSLTLKTDIKAFYSRSRVFVTSKSTMVLIHSLESNQFGTSLGH